MRRLSPQRSPCLEAPPGKPTTYGSERRLRLQVQWVHGGAGRNCTQALPSLGEHLQQDSGYVTTNTPRPQVSGQVIAGLRSVSPLQLGGAELKAWGRGGGGQITSQLRFTETTCEAAPLFQLPDSLIEAAKLARCGGPGRTGLSPKGCPAVSPPPTQDLGSWEGLLAGVKKTCASWGSLLCSLGGGGGGGGGEGRRSRAHLHRDSSPSGAGRGCVSLEELLMADTGPGPAGSFRPIRLDLLLVLLSTRDPSHDFRFDSAVILSSEDLKEAWKAEVRCL
ncbi:hypothetical protein Cadr_000029561 [Camelus dromedarius]|uniref:Uncharacterized protein n=1 Tax=Camelus dromedarius TaxID=9838 RepID=A0A5N4CC56_CAMDR|nr:hypothetical protein Cadr_000029561 [Camelus dromedarius]